MRMSTNMFSSINTKSLITGIIIAFVIVSFAITGFGGRLGKNFDSGTAATVGSQEITMTALNDLVQQYEKQSGDTSQRSAHIQSALNQLIQSQVFIEEAVNLDWKAADLEVVQWLRTLPAFRDDKTKKFKREYYERFIKSGQMTELELYDTGRKSISQQKIQALLTLPIRIPEKLLQEEKRRDSQAFEIEYIELKATGKTLQVREDAEIAKFVADPNNQKKLEEQWTLASKDFEHKAQYNLNGILIGWKEAQRAQGEALNRTKDEAKVIADSIKAKLAAGEKLSKIATEQNDDASAKEKNGGMGWIDDTQIDPPTFEAAKLLSKTIPLSNVIETPFGYRIVELMDYRPESKTTFAEAKNELAKRIIATNIKQQLASEIQAEFTSAIKDKNTAKISEVAAKFDLAWVKLPKTITAKERFIEGIGASDALLPRLFELKNPGELIGDVLNITGKNYVFRLVSRKVIDANTDAKQAQVTAQSTFSRNFQTDSERKLFEMYSRDKKIHINPALQNAE